MLFFWLDWTWLFIFRLWRGFSESSWCLSSMWWLFSASCMSSRSPVTRRVSQRQKKMNLVSFFITLFLMIKVKIYFSRWGSYLGRVGHLGHSRVIFTLLRCLVFPSPSVWLQSMPHYGELWAPVRRISRVPGQAHLPPVQPRQRVMGGAGGAGRQQNWARLLDSGIWKRNLPHGRSL